MSGSSGKLRNLISACGQLPDIPTPSETQVLSAIFQFRGVNASVFEGYDTGKSIVQICTCKISRYCILLNRGGSWGRSHVPLGNGRPAALTSCVLTFLRLGDVMTPWFMLISSTSSYTSPKMLLRIRRLRRPVSCAISYPVRLSSTGVLLNLNLPG
jgi:hypothetical protein